MIKATMKYSNQEQGFTLIELVMVIVLLGILGTVGADFISNAFKGFRSTESRLEIFEEGKTALARMEREIINSIPNAIQLIGSNEIRLGLIAEDIMINNNVTGRYQNSAPTTFIQDQTGTLPTTTIISINNTSWDTFTVNDPTTRRLYTIDDLPGGLQMDLLLDNKPVGIPEESRSTMNRFYAVDKAVRYYFDVASSELRRSQILIDEEDEDFNSLDSEPGMTLAEGVTNLTFDYTQGVYTRNSVVKIRFDITKNNETISFNKEVHARNTP